MRVSRSKSSSRGSSSLWQRRSSSPAAHYSNGHNNNNNNSHSNNLNSNSNHLDDADVAAGAKRYTLPSPPPSGISRAASQSDLEFFEDMVSEPVLVLGFDISHLSRQIQFLVCATGVFMFSLLYGYLQELISVQIANRQLALFLAATQFAGYTGFSFLLRTYVYERRQRLVKGRQRLMAAESGNSLPFTLTASTVIAVPLLMYMGLSLLRAVDLGMTNLSMQYINYPAKTLMKSSRVVFTMMFGVFIARKKYRFIEYLVVFFMVVGLAIFMHADAQHSAVFQPIGVLMLTISLVCDGAISNMSEAIMNNYGVCQDEFIFRMYSIALVALSVAAAVKGDLREGLIWLQEPGTYQEQHDGVPYDQRTWSVHGKIMVLLLFSCMGFFGSSCSAAITKNFGALTMSITSTARKATTLFLSFFLFDNECTSEHVVGIFIFITALLAKSWMRRGHKSKRKPRMIPRSLSTASYTAEETEALNKLTLEDIELATKDLELTSTPPEPPTTSGRMMVAPSSSPPRVHIL